MLLAEIDDQPPLAGGQRVVEILGQIVETGLEPVRMVVLVVGREIDERIGVRGGRRGVRGGHAHHRGKDEYCGTQGGTE